MFASGVTTGTVATAAVAIAAALAVGLALTWGRARRLDRESRRLRIEAERLAATARVRSRFLAMTSHEIRVPWVDGIELTRRIRASDDQAVARLPIIALSAGASGEQRIGAEGVGMDEDVTKPASREDIAAAVARVRDKTDAEAGSPDRSDAEPHPLDLQAFEQQRSTFGDERILRFLGMLAEELERRRVAIDDSAGRDARLELGQHAHAIASAAGNLGFRPLMDLGRAFERSVTTLSAEEFPAALQAFRSAMADAAVAVAALRAEIGAQLADRRAVS